MLGRQTLSFDVLGVLLYATNVGRAVRLSLTGAVIFIADKNRVGADNRVGG